MHETPVSLPMTLPTALPVALETESRVLVIDEDMCELPLQTQPQPHQHPRGRLTTSGFDALFTKKPQITGSSSGSTSERTIEYNPPCESLWEAEFKPKTMDEVRGHTESKARLQRHLERVATHTTSKSLVVLIGPAGVGKTCMLEAAARQRGMRVRVLTSDTFERGEDESAQVAFTSGLTDAFQSHTHAGKRSSPAMFVAEVQGDLPPLCLSALYDFAYVLHEQEKRHEGVDAALSDNDTEDAAFARRVPVTKAQTSNTTSSCPRPEKEGKASAKRPRLQLQQDGSSSIARKAACSQKLAFWPIVLVTDDFWSQPRAFRERVTKLVSDKVATVIELGRVPDALCLVIYRSVLESKAAAYPGLRHVMSAEQAIRVARGAPRTLVNAMQFAAICAKQDVHAQASSYTAMVATTKADEDESMNEVAFPATKPDEFHHGCTDETLGFIEDAARLMKLCLHTRQQTQHSGTTLWATGSRVALNAGQIQLKHEVEFGHDADDDMTEKALDGNGQSQSQGHHGQERSHELIPLLMQHNIAREAQSVGGLKGLWRALDACSFADMRSARFVDAAKTMGVLAPRFLRLADPHSATNGQIHMEFPRRSLALFADKKRLQAIRHDAIMHLIQAQIYMDAQEQSQTAIATSFDVASAKGTPFALLQKDPMRRAQEHAKRLLDTCATPGAWAPLFIHTTAVQVKPSWLEWAERADTWLAQENGTTTTPTTSVSCSSSSCCSEIALTIAAKKDEPMYARFMRAVAATAGEDAQKARLTKREIDTEAKRTAAMTRVEHHSYAADTVSQGTQAIPVLRSAFAHIISPSSSSSIDWRSRK